MSGDDLLTELATRVGQALRGRSAKLSVAESCTGGWIAKVITDIPGSSQWFDRGFVTYTNEAKQEMLGVQADTLEQHGAVSEATVIEMALGAQQRSRAAFSLSVSGIAGPGGGSEEKPVGTVYFAWAQSGVVVNSECEVFKGDREAVRRQAVIYALEGLLRVMPS